MHRLRRRRRHRGLSMLTSLLRRRLQSALGVEIRFSLLGFLWGRGCEEEGGFGVEETFEVRRS